MMLTPLVRRERSADRIARCQTNVVIEVQLRQAYESKHAILGHRRLLTQGRDDCKSKAMIATAKATASPSPSPAHANI